MSKPNQCEGKTQYLTQSDCAGTLKHLNKGSSMKMKSYRCSDCNFWHVGHEVKTRLEPYVRRINKVRRNGNNN